MKKPIIGITMGDPAGVGPELCLRAMRDRAVLRACTPVVFGDAGVLARAAEACGLRPPGRVVPLEKWRGNSAIEKPAVVDCRAIAGSAVRPGKIQAACGRAAAAYIRAAVKAAMAGRVAAVATAPIHKESLRLAGVPYPGHTEMLAALTGARRVCMMLASREIAVSLVTVHTAYASVPGHLTKSRILEVIELTRQAMKRLGKRSPRIVVCGLNPHGGEHGLFGSEERRIIEPAVAAARKKGFRVEGPLSPDTAFLPDKRKKVDAYVAMYHDQGLIPFKMLAFESGVNVTLGLPIVRTSVDHGTAFDIAWRGKASPSSLIQAILWAVRLSA